MRTCIECGCYIPDTWNSCPACFHGLKPENNKIYSAYIVTIGYRNGSTGESKIFMRYENAYSFASRESCSPLVEYVEIWDSKNKERIKIF